MIKILAISASPVEGSSTELVVEKLGQTIKNLLEGQSKESSLELINVNKLTFIPCQACGKAPTPEFCFYEDDLTEIYKKLAECDCFLFGSPIYFDSVSAQGKAFIDRCNCIRPPDFENKNKDSNFIKILKRKRPGAMVLVGGEEGWFEGARRTIAGFFKWVEIINSGMISYRSNDFNAKGTAINDPVVLKEISELANKLVQELKNNEL